MPNTASATQAETVTPDTALDTTGTAGKEGPAGLDGISLRFRCLHDLADRAIFENHEECDFLLFAISELSEKWADELQLESEQQMRACALARREVQ